MKIVVSWSNFTEACEAIRHLHNAPLVRYVKLGVAHAPGTFPPPPRVSDPEMHHGTCVTHLPWCMPGSLTSGFIWSRWRGKRSRYSRRMHNPQFCVSGKRPVAWRQIDDKPLSKPKMIQFTDAYIRHPAPKWVKTLMFLYVMDSFVKSHWMPRKHKTFIWNVHIHWHI